MSHGALFDIFLRLGAATLCGMVLGLNRDLHGKPTGIRTLGLVSLGVAIATVAVLRTGQAIADTAAYSRLLQGIVQGVLTGIGFLGGGVILRNPQQNMVRNLTTAATVKKRTAHKRERPVLFSIVRSYPSEQYQNQHDHQNETKAARGVVAPTGAVRP